MAWDLDEERRKQARLILLYLIVNGKVAVPADNEHLKPGRRGRFLQPAHKYQTFKNSFYPRTIKSWNQLPSTTKECSSVDSYKSHLPKHHY